MLSPVTLTLTKRDSDSDCTWIRSGPHPFLPRLYWVICFDKCSSVVSQHVTPTNSPRFPSSSSSCPTGSEEPFELLFVADEGLELFELE